MRRCGSVPEEMPLGDFLRSCEAYFANERALRSIIPATSRDGMIRCYMGADRSSFSHQLIRR